MTPRRTFGHEDAGKASPESLGAIIKTNDIRTFLETNEKRYIVGPKGTGKSLMLMRKAIDQRQRGDGLCIPSVAGDLVDRLSAAEHVGEKFNYQINDKSQASLAWASVWKHAIFSSVLHHLRDEALLVPHSERDGDADITPWAKEIIREGHQETKNLLDKVICSHVAVPMAPFYYFTELGAKLDASGHRVLKEAREEVRRMSAILRPLRQPVYIYLDNLDDYYELQPSLWVRSMYGQLRAVREITLNHRNIHVFTSIRQDVFEQFEDEMKLQYFDYIAYLRYKKAELLQIFESHIIELDSELLAEPKERTSAPWKAFFGQDLMLSNAYAGVEEDVRDYVYRHTLGRPRDMIHIGSVLLQDAAGHDIGGAEIRACIRRACREIATQYLKEVGPLVEDFKIDQFVRKFVYADVLNRSQIKKGTDDHLEYLQSSGMPPPGDHCCITKPFETLYELGLLGVASHDAEGDELHQEFRAPGQGLTAAADRTLPQSEKYFVHPVLHHLLAPEARTAHTCIGNGLPVNHRGI